MTGFDDGLRGGVGSLALLAAAALLAGAVNAVAGGGTILTFPVLAAILPPDPTQLVAANATSTLGLWPASVVAAWSSRGNRAGMPIWTRWLVLPSALGAAVGTALVLCLPPEWFDVLVPWLILLAAGLFALQPRIAAWAGVGTSAAARLPLTCGLQFLVGVYGGYFGAGIGILMLAALAFLGLGDIHRLNGVKNVLATWINGVATAVFAVGAFAGSLEVSWPLAGLMAVSAMAGSLGASHLARRVPAAAMRNLVAIIGFALAGYYFWRQWQA